MNTIQIAQENGLYVVQHDGGVAHDINGTALRFLTRGEAVAAALSYREEIAQ